MSLHVNRNGAGGIFDLLGCGGGAAMANGTRTGMSSDISKAVEILGRGRLVAFPTETVYGLGGDATNGRAVARIFAAKGRPRFNPLIVHVPGLAEAEALATFDERAREAARRFWPGALSLVLRRREACGLSLLVSAGLD